LTKKLRRPTSTKRRSRVAVPPARRAVTRREYAELAVRLGSAELQMQRNRTVIDALVQRVAQLQEQVSALHANAAQQTLVAELPALPPATTPTVES
jgi:CII-binding regulator of phage lambda lysogenization HflD